MSDPQGFILLLRLLSGAATFGVMFSAALRVGPAPLRRIRERPGLFLRTLLVVWLVVPLFTLLAIVTFRVTGHGATTLLLMAVCPGVPLVLSTTRVVRGSTTTAFTVLVLTAMTEPLLIPSWVSLLNMIHPVELQVSAGQVFAVLGPTVFLPAAFGFLVRAFVSERVIERLGRASDGLYVAGLFGSVVAVLAEGGPLLLQVPLRTFAAASVILVGDVIIGYWTGYPETEDQRAIAMAVALGNPALALAVIEASPDFLESETFVAGALVAAYLLFRGIVLTPLEWWLKRSAKRRRAVLDAGAAPSMQ